MTYSSASHGELLRIIYERRASTRFELAQVAGISRSAANQRIETLLSTGLILPDGATATAGRRATNFSFNLRAGAILVAEIGEVSIKTAIADLAGTLLNFSEFSIDIEEGPEKILSVAHERFQELCLKSGFIVPDIWGIGVAVPGPVDYSSGRAIEPPTMPGWHDFDIPGWFQNKYSCPVLVDQDTNVMALGEQRKRWPDTDPFLFIRIGYGIGAGLVTGNAIYRGARGAAGDIGHLRLKGYDEMPCRCGNVGCVEASAGGWAIIRDLNNQGFTLHSIDDLIRLLTSGNVEASRHLRQAGRILGEAIAAAVNLLNPAIVAIGGPLAHVQEDLIAGVRETIYQRSLPLSTRHLTITTTSAADGDLMQLIGVAMLVADSTTSAQAINERLSK